MQSTCVVCGVETAAFASSGRARKYCSRRCSSRANYLQRLERVSYPCASCAGPVVPGPDNLPPGLARCFACRSREWAAKKAQAPRAGDIKGACVECCGAIVVGSRRHKYCSDECLRRAWLRRGSGSKVSRQDRGYGAEHARIRKEFLPSAYGTDCHLCGQVMWPSQRLHLDHTEDRSGYRGFAHAACNILDGARRGGEATRQAKLRRAREARDAA